MIIRSSLLAFLIIASAVVSADATAIVVLRRPDGIVLAADGRLTVLSEGGERSGSLACKIFPAGEGRWYLIFGGMLTAGRLDLPTITARAVGDTLTMADALAALSTEFRRSVDPVLKSAAPIIGKNFDVGDTVVAVLVAGIDRGTPTVGYFALYLQSKQPLALEEVSATCPDNHGPGPKICPDGRLFYGASLGPIIPDLLVQTPRPAFVERGDAAAARILIERQAAATPDEVSGRPIDVLEITGAGARWVDRDPGSACAAIR